MCTFLDEKLAVKVVGGWPLVSDMLDTTSSYASRCQQDPSQRPAHFDPRCKSQCEYKSEASLSFMAGQPSGLRRLSISKTQGSTMRVDFSIFASTENGGKEDPGKAGKGCEVVVVVGKSVKDARTESLKQRHTTEAWLMLKRHV